MTYKHPIDELDLDSFFLISAGHTAFQLMWAGIELGLYDFLSKAPQSSFNDIAKHLNLEQQPTRILLTGLTVLRIIKKKGNQYTNARLTEKMLVADKPDSYAPVLGWQRYIVYEGLIDFVDSLRKNNNIGLRHFPGMGNTLYERLANDPFKEEVFQQAMSALSHQANFCLRDLKELKNIHDLVDAGGGDGTNAIFLCNHYPDMNLSIFDSESVCKIAMQQIEKKGLSERIKTYPGNFLSDPFPKNIDAILYSHILTIWSPQTNLRLLKKAYEALPEGGSIIIFNMMGNDDDGGPMSTALGSPYFQAIATGDGMLYSWADYEAWLKAAGFLAIQKYDELPLNHGILIGTK